jgi:hypothetical protein
MIDPTHRGNDMRLTLALMLLALPVQAETLSQEIARTGLAATETRLAALPTRTDAETFTLGGVQFLRAIEGTFQDRYAMGLTDRSGMLPLLRLPLADNPNPEPFTPPAITALFAHAAINLAAAKTTLAAIPATSDFAVEIALDDLWFDIDRSGTRAPGEGIADLIATLQPTTIRFDVADAAWTAAYADLLGAICAMVQAYDPTAPIARVLQARTAMEQFGPLTPDPFLGSATPLDAVDLVAMVLDTLNQPPDAAQMARAKQHLRDMVALNREFWTRVAAETDNNREWLPNDAQHSALGLPVPPGTGTAWLAVLEDLDALLTGQKLVPYWRVSGTAGVDVGAMFDDPRPIDLIGWVQGHAALPYLKQGPLVTPDSLAAFDTLMSGQTMLFALYLN